MGRRQPRRAAFENSEGVTPWRTRVSRDSRAERCSSDERSKWSPHSSSSLSARIHPRPTPLPPGGGDSHAGRRRPVPWMGESSMRRVLSLGHAAPSCAINSSPGERSSWLSAIALSASSRRLGAHRTICTITLPDTASPQPASSSRSSPVSSVRLSASGSERQPESASSRSAERPDSDSGS
ncbi:MAG: hypothetical protein J3K34DRAFT_435231 [Monoraphidium minutum]|nr:MAG: hypothetical protein J3K34DRAFT_435231 [Monoraphidium minutum]